jgi:hypothetical protein
MDSQTYDRILKPSAYYFRDTIRSTKTSGDVTKLQPSDRFQKLPSKP